MDTDRRKDEQWEHGFDFFSEEQTIHGTNDTPPTDDTSSPTTTTTTITTTATLQKYNLTLTKKFEHEPVPTTNTTPPFGDDSLGDQDDPQDDGLFETRATLLMEQMASLHGQLGHMLPTRSYYNNGTSSCSLGGGIATTATSSLAPSTLSDQSPPSMISCPYVSSSPLSLSPNNQGEQWASSSFDGYSQNSNDGLLHPLQAAHEDVALYESNLMTMRRQMGLIKDGMDWIQQHPCPSHALATVEEPQDVSQQRQLAQLSQMDQAYHSLQFRMNQAEQQFVAFRQGFNFSQACYAVRVALDTVQANMMQQRTMMTANHHQQVVQAWEESIARTTQQLSDLKLEYPDYFIPDQEEHAYEDRWVAMQQKNELVRTWVEEVRVWFAEAERIRQWIDERRDQLMETTLPDPLGELNQDIQVGSGLEQVKEWQAQHQRLETDMEHFDQQDMARLRSHVKTLTMGGKDLSPADTTTIEITLTTLTTLDKVMHALRTKRDRLHLLTLRALWESEYAKTMQWLHDTENQVDTFLSQKARWTEEGGDSITQTDLIDGLLALEHSLSEFDKTGFTTTVNLYQDFDDVAQEDLPSHLEQRQTNCEQFFEDLFKRMAFVRNVVEQRLAMMDFMALVDQVSMDAHALQSDLKLEAMTMEQGQQDEDLWAERVQAMQERIIPLASAQRIPYPVVTLMVDQQENEVANQMIRHYVGHHRTQLVLMGEAVDGQWQALRQRWQLQQRMKAMVSEADQWKGWANDRSSVVQQNQQHLLNDDTCDLDQLVEWERTLSTIQAKTVAKKSQVQAVKDKAVGLKQAMQDACMAGTTRLDEALEKMTQGYDVLDKDMNEHEEALVQARRRLEQGHSAVDRQKELTRFIQTLRASLPGLKQTCGFITGQSQAQDKDRLDTLTQAVARMKTQVAEKQGLVDLETQEHWAGLMDELAQLDVFQETVQEWYHRQRRLSLVEQSLQDEPEHQVEILAGLGQEIGAAADPTDPLQTANYSCAKERHQVLVQRAQVLVDEARKAQEQRDQDTAWQEYEAQVDAWIAAIDGDCDGLTTRLAQQEQQAWGWVGKAADLSDLARIITSGTKTSYDHYRSNWPLAPRHSTSQDDKIRAALDRLDEILAKEKRQAMMIRQLHVHAKAATDLQDWLDQCGQALNQLTMDIGVQDELDVRASLGRFEAKMESMQPALDGFERLEHKIVESLSLDHKQKVQNIGKELRKGFDHVAGQLKEISVATDRHRHHVGIARKLKDLLHMIGGYRDTLAAIRIPPEVTHGAIHDYGATPHDDEDCLSPWLMTCPLSMIPTDQGIAAARDELDRLEHDIQAHLDNGVQDLDESLLGVQTEMFMDQRKEITQAIAGLTRGIQEKRLWLAEASKLEFILTVLEEWEVLLSALTEVVDRSSPSTTTTNTNTTRADLQARLIDLNTRYRYYEPNIQALVKEAQLVMMMHNEDTKQDARIVAYYNQLTDQWRQLQELTLAKKQALMARIGPLAEPLMMSALHDALPGGHQRRFQQQQDQRRPQTTMSTQTTAPLDRSCARKASYQQLTNRRRVVTPTSAVVAAPPRLQTAERAKKRSSWRESTTKPERALSPNDTTYVADPKNDLDVALGNIVNDSPYAIKVKMVPGEVGRYWFGKKNPKLAYCRILRSRMVMVRVGGGWVELSQFLRDHALLEEGRFTSTREPTTPLKKRHSTPGLRHSLSTPFQPASYYCHPTSPGIKNGNKFLVTDDDGNQVQVTMTKAKNKQSSAYRTPWR